MVGEINFQEYYNSFCWSAPDPELIFEIWNMQCLEHGPTALHICLTERMTLHKARNKITYVTAKTIHWAIISMLAVRRKRVFLKMLVVLNECPERLPFESKLLPAVLLYLRIYFPQITVTVTVLKFGWISITVTVLAPVVTPSFPLIPNCRLESHLN